MVTIVFTGASDGVNDVMVGAVLGRTGVGVVPGDVVVFIPVPYPHLTLPTNPRV